MRNIEQGLWQSVTCGIDAAPSHWAHPVKNGPRVPLPVAQLHSWFFPPDSVPQALVAQRGLPAVSLPLSPTSRWRWGRGPNSVSLLLEALQRAP